MLRSPRSDMVTSNGNSSAGIDSLRGLSSGRELLAATLSLLNWCLRLNGGSGRRNRCKEEARGLTISKQAQN